MPRKHTFSTWKEEARQSQEERANKFLIGVLQEFYNHLKSYGLETPIDMVDKYRNPNPLMFYKVYSDEEMVLVHYLINEGCLNVVIKEKRPLLIKGSISKKGLDYLFLESLLKI